MGLGLLNACYYKKEITIHHVYFEVAKEKILLKAFQEGAIVLIDEINTCGSMEKLMNALLMGRDLQKNRPQKPGFKIIGTENPITYSGRKPRSIALKRRLLKCDFSEYPLSELMEIIQHKGLSLSKASHLAAAYLAARNEAISRHEQPPTLRQLLKVVRTIQKSCGKKGKFILYKGNENDATYNTMNESNELIFTDIKKRKISSSLDSTASHPKKLKSYRAVL